MPILMFIYTPLISSILICVENKVLIYLQIQSQVVNLSIRKTTISGINWLAQKGRSRLETSRTAQLPLETPTQGYR